MSVTGEPQPLQLSLTGDKALSAITDDEFGLNEVVTKLADALATRIRGDGYAIGIDGPWGSGKSTFVNFIADELQKIAGQHVLRFEPWLVGDKSMLIASFFGQLAFEIDRIEGSSEFGSSFTRWQLRRARRKLSSSIRKYGTYVAALAGPLGKAASIDPSGLIGAAAVGLAATGPISKFFGAPMALEQLKAEIIAGLNGLKKDRADLRFDVIIDDVDRLPPDDAVEILRMVQKVADLPCITYLICYDSNVLSEQVRRRLLVKDGRGYTEKILQEVIHIPPQEPFALRRALKAKLQRAFPKEFTGVQFDRDVEYRFHILFDVWAGQFLATPRDVARLFDSVVLNWPLLPPRSDFWDFLWLQLVKHKSHDLYVWTREYLQSVGAYRDGGRAGDTLPGEMAKRLKNLMKIYGWDSRPYISGINSFLPGIASFVFDDESKQKVFDFTRAELGEFEAKRRLGSPSHWRQYFAFEAPSYAIRDSDVTEFLAACSAGVGKARTVLWSLLERKHERRGHFVDLLLDRLLDLPADSYPQAEANGMLATFALTMDDLARETKSFKLYGDSEIWRKSARLLHRSKPSQFVEVVGKAKAVSWLSHVIRDQGFAHGLPAGNRSYPERQWLNRNELDDSIAVITARYEKMGAKRIFKLIYPSEVLFCWIQLGDKDRAREHIATAVQDDAVFLGALEAMRGWQNSSETGVTYPLRAQTIENFLDLEETFTRLTYLCGERSRNRAIRDQASALMAAWEKARS
ncbi:P-loop NTPase fold protein [Bradyrhizobium sp. SZCCHNR1015]|uniref:KAP family P-loop NTPase fold protein n=1 Tax=Bradyrhizobium sp. SZCCHNR1015 TaxID=3057338 RepID=UPI0029161BA4|nr:P-loop NTPase fold protein [Bradyrhizobium sp. SZCCHNR1015]